MYGSLEPYAALFFAALLGSRGGGLSYKYNLLHSIHHVILASAPPHAGKIKPPHRGRVWPGFFCRPPSGTPPLTRSPSYLSAQRHPLGVSLCYVRLRAGGTPATLLAKSLSKSSWRTAWMGLFPPKLRQKCSKYTKYFSAFFLVGRKNSRPFGTSGDLE